MLDKLKDKFNNVSNSFNKPTQNSVGSSSFDDEFGLSENVQQPIQQSKFTKENIKVFGTIGLVVLLLLVVRGVQASNAKKQQILIQQAKTYKEQMTSEPHTSMMYYMELGDSKLSLEATAKLIGHVMDTGCTLAYDQLRTVFEDDSLEQLYPYLSGSPCSVYATAKVVCLKEGAACYDYMLKMSKTGQKYKILVQHDSFKPLKFDIEEFVIE